MELTPVQTRLFYPQQQRHFKRAHCCHFLLLLVIPLTMPFPDNLVQECRAAVALVCRELVHEKKFTGESSLKQKELMEKMFHGTGTHSSHLDQFVDGKGQFAEFHVSHAMENDLKGNEERGSRTSGAMLELKELFHWRNDTRCCVHESGFSRDKITKNGTGESAKLIDPRILDDRA